MAKEIKTLEFTGEWDLAPAPENKDHISLKKKYGLFINGEFVNPKSGKYFPTINPANEEKLAMIAEANEKDVDLAVKAARKAYNDVWSKISAFYKYIAPHARTGAASKADGRVEVSE